MLVRTMGAVAEVEFVDAVMKLYSNAEGIR